MRASIHWYFRNCWLLFSSRHGTGNNLNHSPLSVMPAVHDDSMPNADGTGVGANDNERPLRFLLRH